jgi:hypothetical protein
MRYFFDYTTKGHSLLDYGGEEFHNTAAAIEYAETIAEHLTHNLTNQWAGWSIDVRNEDGERHFLLQIGAVENKQCNVRILRRPTNRPEL